MRKIIIGAACVAIGIAADALFLRHQSLWNDEATQMVGLSLDPIEVTRWLANRVDYDSGVGDDRMPPLSYWAGWAWSKLTGLGETPMRWLGVLYVAMATAVVFAAAARAWGLGAGVAASLLLATSPNVVTTSVEIRAYPLLILESAGIFACLIRYATSPSESRRRWLAGMLACGIAAMYTHFFGVVALGGALLAAFVLARAHGESVLPVIAAGCIAAIAGLGLAPFVLASAGLSSARSAPHAEKLVGLERLPYRLFSHPATSVSPVAVGLAALGFVLGIASGLAPKTRSGSAAAGLALALASGGAVVMLAHLAQSAFEAAQPSYNIWMLPPLAILMASGLAARAGAVRSAAIAAIVLSMAANLYADGQLAFRGDYFAHTPHRPISEILRRLGPAEVAVIHDRDTIQAWEIYAPIRSEFRGRVRQFCYVPVSGDGAGVRVADYPSLRGEIDPTGLPFPHLIVVRSERKHARDIASQIRSGIVPLGDGPVTQALLASGAWERVEQESHLSFVGADVDVFRKVHPPVIRAGEEHDPDRTRSRPFMRDIRIAAAQFEHRDGDKAFNLGRIRDLARKAAAQGAEIVCFHECSVPAYTFLQTLSRDELDAIAEPVPDGPSVAALIDVARESGTVVMAGLIEREPDGRLFNSYVAAGPEGYITKHHKLHPFISPHLSPGRGYSIAEIRGVKVGFLICYDNNLPENVRATTLLGAEVIVMPHVTGCTPSSMPGRGTVDPALWDNRHRDPARLRQEFQGPKGRGWLMRWLPARAWENGVFAVFANNIGRDSDTIKPGLAMILDPSGETIVESQALEDDVVVGLLTAEALDDAPGRRYLRARRPELYGKLVEPHPPGHRPVTSPGWRLAYEPGDRRPG